MLHDILKDFKGSQTGSVTDDFHAGTQADLSESLAAIAVRENWARPAKDTVIENKAIVSDGSHPKRRSTKAQ